ncbi:hypothetical protein PV10_06020 [Exophiala mesophila]|uniref:Enoyl reductase (ER) domain-containing protein n=1 Tax=Exophiala mesophila TaxID=212818 RepID=A0A0D1WQX1_EXOME|nr:uncharacterized protein PV10_06020 [Exophiala mesophila]KIV91485.1 hypothetical protein PV10_06020 [Exophiala mesophila]
MKAIVMQGEPGKASMVTDRPVPKPRPGYLLVEPRAVALNPTDWKHIHRMNTKGCLLGSDYAGVVIEPGTGYDKDWKVGDRLFGFVNGGNHDFPEDGSFAEKIIVKADIQMRIPDYMSFEDASTLGVGVITCGQGLFQQMGLNSPDQPASNAKGEYILIYGGSSATGTLGIQLTKLAGYTPITTCSARNFNLVKSLGAAAVFDYSDPECVTKIKLLTDNKLRLVWDTIASPETAKFCTDCIVSGGTYGAIVRVKCPREDVKHTYSLGTTCFGEPVHKYGFHIENTTKDFEFTKKWTSIIESLLEQRQLKVHPSRVGQGLENVLGGTEEVRLGKISGQKLVYTI